MSNDLRRYEDLVGAVHVSTADRLTVIAEAIGNAVLTLTGAEAIKQLVDLLASGNQSLERLKQASVIGQLAGKVDELDVRCQAFFGDPHGWILFNKLGRILETRTPAPYALDAVSSALAYMMSDDFKKSFDTHAFYLSVAENTPDAAWVILIDRQNWPSFNAAAMSFNADPDDHKGPPTEEAGTVSNGEWEAEFSRAYAFHREIQDATIHRRLTYMIRLLAREGLVCARRLDRAAPVGDDDTARCELTRTGEEFVKYLEYRTRSLYAGLPLPL